MKTHVCIYYYETIYNRLNTRGNVKTNILLRVKNQECVGCLQSQVWEGGDRRISKAYLSHSVFKNKVKNC